MNTRMKLGTLILLASFSLSALAQSKPMKSTRRPAAQPDASAANGAPPRQPNYVYFAILDGLPIALFLHHDTEVGTGKPVDVYEFVIEMQVLNSDGNLEPVGLQIHNFYTAEPQNPNTAPNPHNARDCKFWNNIINTAINNRSSKAKVWPYVEFTTALGARTLQTNEHGQVFWSDDVECWGSMDRFPPF
jgi:hypothetical protein